MPPTAGSPLLIAIFISCTGDDGPAKGEPPPPLPHSASLPHTGVGPCDGDEPAVTLGTGTDAFEPLADGAPLSFYLGPQGGYHVFASLRATDLPPGDPLDPFGAGSPVVSLEVSVDDARIGGYAQLPRLFVAGADGVELVGQLLVLEVPDPPSLDGTAATLSTEVRHPCGRVATDARDVVLSLYTGAR
jgi:hypothetical protein